VPASFWPRQAGVARRKVQPRALPHRVRSERCDYAAVMTFTEKDAEDVLVQAREFVEAVAKMLGAPAQK
jgi:hypothetical protein